MKKILSLCLLMATVCLLQAQTPITLSVDDIGSAGNSYRVANVNPLIVFDGADTGPDHNWDFSSLVATTHDTSSFVPVADTNPLYFFLWLVSDLAQKTGGDIVNAFVTISDVYNFFERTADHYSQTGFAGTISGIPLPIAYDDPETIFEFPANYNNTTSSLTGFAIDIPGVATWIEQRDRTNTIDGWGTIETPTGTYNVLRMKSETAIVDTFIYDVFTVPVAYTSIEYRWMAKENGIPILQVNSTSIFGIETISQIMYKEGDIVSAINEQIPENGISILQNPVKQTLTAQLNIPSDNYNYSITGIDGKIFIENKLVGNGTMQIFTEDVSSLPSGIYLLNLSNTSGNHLTQKFVKN